MENLNTKEALAYCFKCLDFNQKKYLSETEISFFMKLVSEKMLQFGFEPVPIVDVVVGSFQPFFS
jgi:hypothetical protein